MSKNVYFYKFVLVVIALYMVNTVVTPPPALAQTTAADTTIAPGGPCTSQSDCGPLQFCWEPYQTCRDKKEQGKRCVGRIDESCLGPCGEDEEIACIKLHCTCKEVPPPVPTTVSPYAFPPNGECIEHTDCLDHQFCRVIRFANVHYCVDRSPIGGPCIGLSGSLVESCLDECEDGEKVACVKNKCACVVDPSYTVTTAEATTAAITTAEATTAEPTTAEPTTAPATTAEITTPTVTGCETVTEPSGLCSDDSDCPCHQFCYITYGLRNPYCRDKQPQGKRCVGTRDQSCLGPCPPGQEPACIRKKCNCS